HRRRLAGACGLRALLLTTPFRCSPCRSPPSPITRAANESRFRRSGYHALVCSGRACGLARLASIAAGKSPGLVDVAALGGLRLTLGEALHRFLIQLKLLDPGLALAGLRVAPVGH